MPDADHVFSVNFKILPTLTETFTMRLFIVTFTQTAELCEERAEGPLIYPRSLPRIAEFQEGISAPGVLDCCFRLRSTKYSPVLAVLVTELYPLLRSGNSEEVDAVTCCSFCSTSFRSLAMLFPLGPTSAWV
jgi:hypothetical protein